ncbi:hypothetical protein E4U21_002954 [Claviceps maximensis]|nr:hypothetical protein E4U21_002954 [Claviceps maximensis]
METKEYMRNKCTVYNHHLNRLKHTNEKLRQKVDASQRELADRDARLASLEARLDAERKESSRRQGLEMEALRAEKEHAAYLVRVYKTALKATFKLPGVEAQATYRSMLEATERQMRKSLGEEGVVGVEALVSASSPCSSSSAADAAAAVPPGQDEHKSTPDTPRTPDNNKKRGVDSDSDDAPAPKKRRTPRGSARKILHDD